MCLSSVFIIKSNNQKELLCKNIAKVEIIDGELVFNNVMGIPTKYRGTISSIDLVDNHIYVTDN